MGIQGTYLVDSDCAIITALGRENNLQATSTTIDVEVPASTLHPGEVNPGQCILQRSMGRVEYIRM